MRGLRFITLAAGLALLGTSFGLVLRGASQDRFARLAHGLRTEVGTEAARLDEYLERSRALLSQLADNPALRDFYEAPGTREDKVAQPATIAETQRALAYLDTLLSGNTSEICFIDAGGAENARVVRGQIAPVSELSADETGATFFQPTLDLQPGEVYQSAPYVSPDTNEWVVSNSMLIPAGAQPSQPGQPARAMVHFEIQVDGLRAAVDEAAAVGRTRLIDGSGRVIVDSAHPQTGDTALGHSDQRQFEPVLGRLAKGDASTTTVVTAGGEVVAIRALEGGSSSPNTWYVAVSAPPAEGLFSAVSATSLILFGTAGLVFGVAIASMFANERRLRTLATTDALTGLANRALFSVRATQAIELAKRDQTMAAVLLLDLDRFKEVNDTLGHHRGDQLLCEVANRLNGVLRESDTIARLGGDEFALFLARVDGLAGAVRAAERIAHALSGDSLIADVAIQTNASVGIAMYPDHGTTIGDLLQHADVAMYKAKRSGNDFAVYSVDDDPHSTQRLSLAADLRSGIERGELRVHYQPKYDLRSMSIIGVEALVRWEHPRLGLLQPGDFLRSAEASGSLRVLTSSVMNTAFQQLADWYRDGWDLTMAVNVSPQTISEPAFLDDLRAALQRSGANPERIVIEITENALFEEFAASNRALSDVRGLGCAISIDDFGTGYSSLSYLRDLPIDEVKIDRSFVMSLQDEVADQAIVESTIALAHSLGYRVVAEGIETVEALNLLNTMGCELGQGFFLRRPATAIDIGELLTNTSKRLDRVEPMPG